MSQRAAKNNTINLEDSKAHAEEASHQMPRVSDIEIDQQGIVVNAVPINMVPQLKGKSRRSN
jgi:hypothetical protein